MIIKKDTPIGFEPKKIVSNQAPISEEIVIKKEIVEEAPTKGTLLKDILASAVPCRAKPSISARTSNGGGITIVNCKCGVRIEFSKTILNELDYPEKVSFSFLDDMIIITNNVEDGSFFIRPMGTRKVLYNASLVHEITEKYSLDFTNCSCISFSDYRYIENVENTVAISIK